MDAYRKDSHEQAYFRCGKYSASVMSTNYDCAVLLDSKSEAYIHALYVRGFLIHLHEDLVHQTSSNSLHTEVIRLPRACITLYAPTGRPRTSMTFI